VTKLTGLKFPIILPRERLIQTFLVSGQNASAGRETFTPFIPVMGPERGHSRTVFDRILEGQENFSYPWAVERCGEENL
jgi:hypothetical protein